MNFYIVFTVYCILLLLFFAENYPQERIQPLDDRLHECCRSQREISDHQLSGETLLQLIILEREERTQYLVSKY